MASKNWALRIVTGAVKSAIDSHGSITVEFAPSVAKRVVAALIAGGVIHVGSVPSLPHNPSAGANRRWTGASDKTRSAGDPVSD